MTKEELNAILSTLGLTQVEAARLLSVGARTFRRWIENPKEIPGPAERALNAWCFLKSVGLPWRPDGASLLNNEEVKQQIVKFYEFAFANNCDAIHQGVQKRGGPVAPWIVDIKGGRATLGPMEITFYMLPKGGFAPLSYCRHDKLGADPERDLSLIEDGYVLIAQELQSKVKKKKS